MIVKFSWHGAGLVVLVVLPVVLGVALLCSVNLIGKDFTKAHFHDIVVASFAASGIVCLLLGRWLNREQVVRKSDDWFNGPGVSLEDEHQMWGIPVQHWCWIYFVLAVLVAFA